MLPQQPHVADRAIPLFRDDDLGGSLDPFPILVGGLVVLLTVHEHDDVGILLDRTRLTEVVQPWPIVPRHLRLAVELGETDHGNFEFSRHHFQTPGDPGHLLLPRIPGVVGLDQLQVVDHHEGEALATLEPPRDCRDFRERPSRSVVDVERRRPDLVRLLHEPASILLRDRAVAQAMAVDLRRRAEQPVGEFHAGHFQAHEEHRQLQVDRDVLGDVHREGRLPHARPGREDDQFRVVQTPAQRVEIGESRLDAADRMLMLHAGVHPHEHLLEHRVDRLGVGIAATLEDRENTLLGPRQELPRLVARVVRVAEDFRAGIDEGSKHGLVTDDGRVMRGMGRMRHRLHDIGEGPRPADPLEIALAAQLFEDDRHVDPLAPLVQLQEIAVEELIRLVREILRSHDERHVVADVRLEQDAAEHRPLGVDVRRAIAILERRGRTTAPPVASEPPLVARLTPTGCDHFSPASLPRTTTPLPQQGGSTPDDRRPATGHRDAPRQVTCPRHHRWSAPPTPSDLPPPPRPVGPARCRARPPSAAPGG